MSYHEEVNRDFLFIPSLSILSSLHTPSPTTSLTYCTTPSLPSIAHSTLHHSLRHSLHPLHHSHHNSIIHSSSLNHSTTYYTFHHSLTHTITHSPRPNPIFFAPDMEKEKRKSGGASTRSPNLTSSASFCAKVI